MPLDSVVGRWTDGPVNVIARDMNLSHSTVSTILKDKERIREAVKGSAPMQSTIITKQRSGPIHEMEKLLYIWMKDQIKKRPRLNQSITLSVLRHCSSLIRFLNLGNTLSRIALLILPRSVLDGFIKLTIGLVI